jgi:ribosomal protein S18 acetylase RimI-like enzyme
VTEDAVADEGLIAASGTALRIRQATLADLTAIVELRVALLREHANNPLYRRIRPDAPSRAKRLFAKQLRSPNEVVFLAERGETVAGVLRCVQSSGFPLLFPTQYGYISSVYVVPRERRSGVLRALFARAVGWCRERGLAELRLHCAADNPTANAAWDALGFEIAEHLRVQRLL